MITSLEREAMLAEFRLVTLAIVAIVAIVWLLVGYGAFGQPAQVQARAAAPVRAPKPARRGRPVWAAAPVPAEIRRPQHRRPSGGSARHRMARPARFGAARRLAAAVRRSPAPQVGQP